MSRRRIASIIVATIILIFILIITTIPYIIFEHIVSNDLINMQKMRAMQCAQKIQISHIKISEIYQHLKTGDILLFVSSSRLNISQTFFSHVAMIVRYGDDLIYTSESQIGNEIMSHHRMKKGTTTAPLLVRIKYYLGTTYIMRLSRPLEPYREQLIKNAINIYHPYPTLFSSVLAILFGFKNNSQHCFQHIAHLLAVTGLRCDHNDSFIRVCREICDLPTNVLSDGFYYEPPIELIYDIAKK